MKTRKEVSGLQLFPTMIIILATVVLAIVLRFTDSQDEEAGRQANYCEMRQIYIDSNSEYGWPRMDGYGECK